MDNMNLIKKLPPMLSGSELERALTILPEYNPAIAMENEAMRLIALSTRILFVIIQLFVLNIQGAFEYQYIQRYHID